MKTKNMKNNIIAELLAVALLLLAEPALAQEHVGNGGDVVVCPVSSPRPGSPNKRVILLDAHEAQKRGFEIEIPGATLREKVATLTSRIMKFDQVVQFGGKKIEDLAQKMVDDIELGEKNKGAMTLVLMSEDPLTDVDDSLETSIPKNCHKEQLIINKQRMFPKDRKFEMRSDLWKLMDLDNQALTVMHESIYDWMIKDQAGKDSRFSRYLNGFFAQKNRSFVDFINLYNQFFHLPEKSEKQYVVSGPATVKILTSEEAAELYVMGRVWNAHSNMKAEKLVQKEEESFFKIQANTEREYDDNGDQMPATTWKCVRFKSTYVSFKNGSISSLNCMDLETILINGKNRLSKISGADWLTLDTEYSIYYPKTIMLDGNDNVISYKK